MTETSPDEDVLAVDCGVDFAEASVRVQVKCTSQFSIGGRSAGWVVKPHWRQAWSKAKVPVYLVLVIVRSDPTWWLDHPADGTFHHTAAFWCRLRPAEIKTRVRIPKKQRLTRATLDEWHKDLLEAFSARAES